MRRLPSVNRLVNDIEQLVKKAEAEQENVQAPLPSYTAPIAAELQKVAQACRNASTDVTVGDVLALAHALRGGNR